MGFSKSMMSDKFLHEDVAEVPSGYKVRSIKHPSGHVIRLAFPPGARQAGSGKMVSILHPATEHNPVFCSVKREFGGVKGNPRGKQKTLDQVERMQAKAVRFLRDVVGDEDKASEIEGLSPQEYAERKRVTISNPQAEVAPEAIELYRQFHGEDPHGIISRNDDALARGDYVTLGELVELGCITESGEEIELGFEGVKLASNFQGSQLYLVGGDQSLNLEELSKLGVDVKRSPIVIGHVETVVYTTRKDFDDFELADYEHEFGEEGGELPLALYDARLRHVHLIAGTYKVERPGIIN